MDLRNVGLTASARREKMLADYQANATHQYKKGNFVQKGFISKDGGTEHIWILVAEVDEANKVLFGLIENDPLTIDLKLGDRVEVKFEEISQLLK